MTDGEKYYDEVIAPKLSELAKDAQAHGLNFLAMVEWAPGEHGRMHYCVEGTQGLSLRMANWAAQCNGNVDSFWMAVQRYAMKYGHGSVFLTQQGIPSKPNAAGQTPAANKETK
jgi:hypothetical protein